MYVCLCNPFSDRDVQDHLQEAPAKVKVSEVYKSCSGGESPQCCRCLPTVKEMVATHHARHTVREMSRDLPEAETETGNTVAGREAELA